MTTTTTTKDKARFNDCMNFVLSWEGGYVNNPKDRGKETNRGITKAVFEEAKKDGLINKERILKELTKEEAVTIYKKKYWDSWGWGNLPYPLSLCMFDMAVNHGGRGMAFIVQRAINSLSTNTLTVDGKYGKNTEKELYRLAEEKPLELSRKICDYRKDFYDRIIQSTPQQAVFRRGWYNRAEAMRKKVEG